MFKRIVVAYDGSDGAQAALKFGIALAKNAGTELSSISVEEHLPRYAATISEVEGAREQIDEHFHALTKQARDTAGLQGVELETAVRQGHELTSILDFACERRSDLLVLGSLGHSRVLERLIGSTSLSLLREALRDELRHGVKSFRDFDRVLWPRLAAVRERLPVAADRGPISQPQGRSFRRGPSLAAVEDLITRMEELR
jgi:nucleotide-binding universal stress UspA family protein